jgi:hypothetical protein
VTEDLLFRRKTFIKYYILNQEEDLKSACKCDSGKKAYVIVSVMQLLAIYNDQAVVLLWDHLHRIWTFRNGVLHENNQGRIAHCKLEALQRKIEVVWDRYNVQQGRMETTLQGHLQQWDIINKLRHNSKACWTLATLYLDETENTTALGNPGLETFLMWRSGIG